MLADGAQRSETPGKVRSCDDGCLNSEMIWIILKENSYRVFVTSKLHNIPTFLSTVPRGTVGLGNGVGESPQVSGPATRSDGAQQSNKTTKNST